MIGSRDTFVSRNFRAFIFGILREGSGILCHIDALKITLIIFKGLRHYPKISGRQLTAISPEQWQPWTTVSALLGLISRA